VRRHLIPRASSSPGRDLGVRARSRFDQPHLALALLLLACSAVPPSAPPRDVYGPRCRAAQAEVQRLAQGAPARACQGDADCEAIDVRGLPGCCWLATSAQAADSPALRQAAAAAARVCGRVDKACGPHCTVRCLEGACRAPPHCNADPACS